MTAWQCDNKEWMKQRQAKWKIVQKRVNDLYFLRKEWKAAVKHFFLTGEDIEGQYCMKTLEIAPLFELWFDPDRSKKNWANIKRNYEDKEYAHHWKWADSKRRLKEVLNGLGMQAPYYNTSSFFDGLEERLYDVFFKRGLKREHYPELNDEEFFNYAWDSYRGIAASIKLSLFYEISNPYNAVNFMLEQWRDSIILAFDPERGELQNVLEKIDQAALNPENFTSEQNSLAQRVALILDDQELPQAAKDKINEIRQRSCHPEGEIYLSGSQTILRFITKDADTAARIVFYLDEEKRPELVEEVPGHEQTLFTAMESATRPKKIEQPGITTVDAWFEHIDEQDIVGLFQPFDAIKGITGKYAYYTDADDYRVYLQYRRATLKRIYCIEQDDEIDKKLSDMNWDEKALGWILEHKLKI